MDFFLFLFLHPSSFCLETPLWIRDSPLFRFLVAVSWGRGVLYLSAISIIISTFIRLHSLRSSDHFWALPASNVHLPAFTAVFVLHSLSRLPPPLPRSVQHFPTSVTGAWTLPLSVLDDLHLRGCRIWTRDLCHCSLALYHLSHPSPKRATHLFSLLILRFQFNFLLSIFMEFYPVFCPIFLLVVSFSNGNSTYRK